MFSSSFENFSNTAVRLGNPVCILSKANLGFVLVDGGTREQPWQNKQVMTPLFHKTQLDCHGGGWPGKTARYSISEHRVATTTLTVIRPTHRRQHRTPTLQPLSTTTLPLTTPKANSPYNARQARKSKAFVTTITKGRTKHGQVSPN